MTTPILDRRAFPLVWLRPPPRTLDAGEAEALIVGLTRLLDDGQPYAIASDGGPPALPRDAERDFALWFKAERERLGRLCRGMALVIPPGPAHEAAARQIDRAAAAYPYPVAVVADAGAAAAWARERLTPAGS